MPHFAVASLDALSTCDERWQEIAHSAIRVWDFSVLECHRNRAKQDAMIAAGTSLAHWPTSKHNSMPSLAIDLAPWYPKNPGGIDWRTDHAMMAAAYDGNWRLVRTILENVKRWQAFSGFIRGIAHARGIKVRSGADWDGDARFNDHKLIDLPHYEIIE